MFFLILLMPIFGCCSGLCCGYFLGAGVCYIIMLFIFLTFVLSFVFFIILLYTGCSVQINLMTWINLDSLKIEWFLNIDSLTAIMLIIVSFISSLVHLYSLEYMKEDPHLIRFMSYLSLFTFFMLLLVIANNFLQLFVGWEGVGLSSYLLINFWFTRIQANKAAIKAMLVNRVGDFFILLGLFLIILIFNTLNYEVIFNLTKSLESCIVNFFFFRISIIDLICCFLFFGCIGKSAQLGLHVWLPDAMEGPTPVSALIHAATMVTAGVFLISRCSFIFEYSNSILKLITIIGALTAFFAATTGLLQNDIKKVIAYSTCSQLGYMIFACGLSGYEIGIFHLFTHAFFKALLFLGAGGIIHALSNEQDMRKMGGLKNILPFSYAITIIGSLTLIGFPFLSGFFSKDVILEIALAKYSIIGHFSYYLGLFAIFFTAFYSSRLIYLIFLNGTNLNRILLISVHEGSWKIFSPLFILSLCSLFIGFLAREFAIGFGSNFYSSSLFFHSSHYLSLDIEFLSWEYKILPLFFTFFGVYTGFNLYILNLQELFFLKQEMLIKKLYNFFIKKWYFDKIYNNFLNKNILLVSKYFTYQNVDRGLLELLGPYGIIFIIKNVSKKINFFQTGYLYYYLILLTQYMFIVLIILLTCI